MEIIFWLIVVFVGLYIYFLPTVIARKKNNPNVVPIFLVNLFFGATLIGWVGAMVWATLSDE